MAIEPLRNDLADAGEAFLGTLDRLGLGVSGAAWLYFRGFEDWRFFVATPLVDSMGLKRVYSLLADALEATGTPDGMTVLDLHLESPSGVLFSTLSGGVGVSGASRAYFYECNINGMPVDGLMYRMDRNAAAPSIKLPKKAEADFRRAVKQVLAHAA